jgi:hypothetical protein
VADVEDHHFLAVRGEEHAVTMEEELANLFLE